MAASASWKRTAFAAALAAALGGCAGDPMSNSVPDGPRRTVAALKRLGHATLEAGDTASAVGFYRRAHEMSLHDFDALLGLARALARQGAYEEAAEALRDALEIRRDDPEARRELGNVMIALGRPALAAAEFQASLAKVQDARSFNGLGIALDMMGDMAAAQAHYRAGLALDPANLPLRNNLGLSLAVSGRYAEAAEMLEPVARAPSATARERQNLALAYALAGEREKAAQIARTDLDEIAVRRNLAHYDTLRALGDPRRIAEAVGFLR